MTLDCRPKAYWDAITELVERRLDDVVGLASHGLGALAADELERRGQTVPDAFRHYQRVARVADLTAPLLARKVRDACDGPVLLFKGPEAAERYPNHARPYGDLDLLVADSERAQHALLRAGFVEENDAEGLWVGIHHLGRLRLPGSALAIEVHSEPKWLDGCPPPATEELLEAAGPSVTGVEGILAPSPAHHALLLAAHGWAHQPLGRVRDLVDIGALRTGADRMELDRTAAAWGVSRLWRTTTEALDAILLGGATWPLRLWATHLRDVRDQTVLETHLERLLAPIWGYPPALAARRFCAAARDEIRPAFDEDWREKVKRSAMALRRPLTPVTEHRHKLGDAAARGQRRNPRPDADQ